MAKATKTSSTKNQNSHPYYEGYLSATTSEEELPNNTGKGNPKQPKSNSKKNNNKKQLALRSKPFEIKIQQMNERKQAKLQAKNNFIRLANYGTSKPLANLKARLRCNLPEMNSNNNKTPFPMKAGMKCGDDTITEERQKRSPAAAAVAVCTAINRLPSPVRYQRPNDITFDELTHIGEMFGKEVKVKGKPKQVISKEKSMDFLQSNKIKMPRIQLKKTSPFSVGIQTTANDYNEFGDKYYSEWHLSADEENEYDSD